ncbi:MAG TPA: ThuA domain-containing protein [Pirellulales bacterium]|nr:ThuA domain-containing protein [Pirellulales bacterium]
MKRRRFVLFAVLVAIGPFSGYARDSRAADAAADQPIRALLVIGGGSHDYLHQKDILVQGLTARANIHIKVAFDPANSRLHPNPVYDDPDWAKGFDVVIHDESVGGVTDLKLVDRILKPHREGLPAVVLHSGMHAYRTEGWPKAVTPWFEFTGLQTTGHGPQFPIAVRFIDPDSPITKGLADWTTIKEELYNNAAGKLLDTAHPLARGKQTVKIGPKKANGDDTGSKANGPTKERTDDNIVVWTNLYNGKSRVFATTLGHNNETVGDPRYLDLVVRGLLWSVDRLDESHLKPAAGGTSSR